MMQEILVFGLVAVAAAYLLWRAVRKSKAGCGCGEGGCCAGKTAAIKK